MGIPRAVLVPVVLAVSAPATPAEDRFVSPGESIQAAIDAASAGDRVLVEAGTYPEAIDFLGKAISVIGVCGALSTTIDATGLGGPVVSFENGEGPDSVLVGFTITGGNATSNAIAGGGIHAWDGGSATTPTVMDCIVRDNHASFANGGGVAGNPTLVRCSIHGNSVVDGEGGGVFGAPLMRHCVVAANSVSGGSGGGIHVGLGDASIEDCVIVANGSYDTGRGGGVEVGEAAAGSATLKRCVIAGNTVDAGIMATSLGGAVHVAPGGTADLESCTIVGNLAATTPFGTSIGGIVGACSLRNSIVRDNSFVQIDSATATSVTYCNVQGSFGGTGGNIDADPGFVAPAAGDYHLVPGSPCIDAGDFALVDPDGTRSDIGAFPFQSLYTRANTTPGGWTDPGWPTISSLVGGKQVLRLQAGAAAAGRLYWTLGSTSGTTPGTELLGAHVPLNPDGYYLATLERAATLRRGIGYLDGNGRGEITLFVPPADGPFAAGSTVHHAVLVLDFQRSAGKALAHVSASFVSGALSTGIE